MEKTVPSYLQRSKMLLELAKSQAGDIQFRWRSQNLGNWDSVHPRWSVLGGKIRFQFYAQGQLLSYWAASVRRHDWGISVSLADSRRALPEIFDMVWQESAVRHADPRHLWKIVKGWLVSRFPGHRIVRAARRPDLSHTLSGSFLRVLFRHAGQDHFLIAADPDSGDEIHQAAGQALLWLSTGASASNRGTIPKLHVLVPEGMSAVLFHRCSFFDKNRIKAEVWEYAGNNLEHTEVRCASTPPPPEEEKDFRWPVLGPFRWSSRFERVLDLAPALIRRYPRFNEYDSLRLWGLEFAQAIGSCRDRIFFGVGPQRTELTDENFIALRSLVEEILYFRRPDSPDIRHPYYRLQAERWLEALVLEDIPGLFPELAPESVYSQIPVYVGKDSGRIDILGADRQGTLVVMELKVAADPDLPIQALDYWGRVIQHNKNGDFERRGYFSEVRLSRRHPKIYLVSPVFSFHDTTELLLRYLEPDLEVCKISINEDWRSGVKILRRVQCKEK